MSTIFAGPHAASHAPSAADQLYYERGHKGSTVVDNIPRFAANAAPAMTAGTIMFCYLTPDAALTITSVRLRTGATPASGSPTHTWVGLYTAAANGNVTLVFQSADIAALTDATVSGSPVFFSQASKLWTVPLTLDAAPAALGSYVLVRGQRYAVAFLQVGGTAPILTGVSSTAETLNATLGPRIAGTHADTTLATSYTSGQVADTGLCPYVALM